MGLDMMQCLRGASVTAAMRLAVARSGLSGGELAESMGWTPSVANRILSNGDYWPSLPTLPRLCAVLGNDLIPRWILANIPAGQKDTAPLDAAGLIQRIGELFKEGADVAAECRTALADGCLSAREARRIMRELRDVETVAGRMLAELQATIEAGGGRS